MTPSLRRACSRALHVVRPELLEPTEEDDRWSGATLRAGEASLFVLSRIGWPRTARVLSAPPLGWLVEVGYFLVSRNRSWLGRLWSEE